MLCHSCNCRRGIVEERSRGNECQLGYFYFFSSALCWLVMGLFYLKTLGPIHISLITQYPQQMVQNSKSRDCKRKPLVLDACNLCDVKSPVTEAIALNAFYRTLLYLLKSSGTIFFERKLLNFRMFSKVLSVVFLLKFRWQAICYAWLNHSVISFFNFLKPETAASQSNRVSLNASKVKKMWFFL